MKPYLILFATREGHTAQIAEHLHQAMWKRGLPSVVQPATELPADFHVENYEGAIVAASVHREHHEIEIVEFVKAFRQQLEAMPTVFLSVSLSEAGAEDVEAPAEKRAAAAADAQRMIDAFLAETHWHPGKIKAVAGALLYSKYNFLLRLIMKRIARAAGGDIDTSRDYDYTDWAALDHLIDQLVAEEADALKGVPSGA